MHCDCCKVTQSEASVLRAITENGVTSSCCDDCFGAHGESALEAAAPRSSPAAAATATDAPSSSAPASEPPTSISDQPAALEPAGPVLFLLDLVSAPSISPNKLLDMVIGSLEPEERQALALRFGLDAAAATFQGDLRAAVVAAERAASISSPSSPPAPPVVEG